MEPQTQSVPRSQAAAAGPLAGTGTCVTPVAERLAPAMYTRGRTDGKLWLYMSLSD